MDEPLRPEKTETEEESRDRLDSAMRAAFELDPMATPYMDESVFEADFNDGNGSNCGVDGRAPGNVPQPAVATQRPTETASGPSKLAMSNRRGFPVTCVLLA